MNLPYLKIRSKNLLATLFSSTIVGRHLKLIYSDEILYFKAIEFLREATVFETLNIWKIPSKSANRTLPV